MIFDDFRWFSMIFDDFRWFSMIFRWFCFNICKTNLKINFILSTATVRIRERKRLKNISVTFQNLWHSSICDGVAFVIFHYLLYCRIPYSSGSQTSPVRGPLIIIWWSAKQNILICIGISGPPVVRGADFGNHWLTVYLMFSIRDIIVSVTYQYLWHISICDISVSVTYQYLCHISICDISVSVTYQYLWHISICDIISICGISASVMLWHLWRVRVWDMHFQEESLICKIIYTRENSLTMTSYQNLLVPLPTICAFQISFKLFRYSDHLSRETIKKLRLRHQCGWPWALVSLCALQGSIFWQKDYIFFLIINFYAYTMEQAT